VSSQEWHRRRAEWCPLSGVKRTSKFKSVTSAFGPKADIPALAFLSGRSNSSKILRGIEDDRRRHTIATPKIIVDPISEIRRLRREHTDRLLTPLAILLALEMFVFAPLQAVGVFIFHGFAIAALLAIIGGMLIISDSSKALEADSSSAPAQQGLPAPVGHRQPTPQ
jgi:hypothetical protein